MAMTPDERRARAERYRAWWDRDGMADAVRGLQAAYIERIADLDPADRGFADKARILTIAAKVAKQVEQQVLATVGDGSVAVQEIEKLERMKSLSAERKRWL